MGQDCSTTTFLLLARRISLARLPNHPSNAKCGIDEDFITLSLVDQEKEQEQVMTDPLYDYVIVGAGPAGLQMAYFLHQAQRRYIVLEAADSAASFFKVHPRHRKLLSINKIHNLYSEHDFNLRHDWNSLLSHDESLLFRNYSRDLFPNADDLHKYFTDFAERSELRIEYGCPVESITGSDGNFTVTTQGRQIAARCVLMATGARKEHLPENVEGLELATSYAEHELDLSVYENKRVAIVGRGNSAFEVADHLAGSAAVIHLMVGKRPVKHAWNTHFVGDLRAVNNTVLDMYQLKSLHATLGFEVMKIARNSDGSLKLSLQEEVPHWSPPGTYRASMDYDHVILCTGWSYCDSQLFAEANTPEVDKEAKYPKLSSIWESSVRGLFYIGTAMAARDRKAASGFIHGFRYNIASLFQLLEERYSAQPLPDKKFSVQSESDLAPVAAEVIRRVSTASDLYQMNGVLVDVVLVNEGTASYLTGLPVDHVRERADFAASDFAVVISLEYGFHNYTDQPTPLDFTHPSDPSSPECSAFLHPVIRCYKKGAEVEEYHLGESLIVRYDQHFSTDAFYEGFSNHLGATNENRIKNLFNRHLNISKNVLDESLLAPGVNVSSIMTPWTDEQIRNRGEQKREQEQEQENLSKSAKCRYTQ